MRSMKVLALAAATAALLTACGAGGDTPTATSEAPGGSPACEPGRLPTLTEGVLTVGTSDPYEPWYIGDDPTTGEGFEAALVYAVAEQLGYAEDDVEWTSVTFEQIVSPSVKPFDIAAYQTSITPERAEAVDFSSPYLTTRQGVVVDGEGEYAGATALADLEGARVGVTASQTSLTVAESAWGGSVELVPFDGAGDAMQQLVNGQVDAVVMDVDQATAATTSYFPGTQIVGTLPDGGVVEQLGLVLDLESALTTCVSGAVDELAADGTLDALRQEWLDSDDIPELG